MVRKMMFVLLVLTVSQAALAVDHFWIGNPAGGDWNTVGNWSYTQGGAACATVPTTADKTYVTAYAADRTGFTPDPVYYDDNFELTHWAGSYDSWTNQVINVSGTAGTSQFRGSNGSDYLNNLTSSTLNFLSGAVFTDVGDFTPARNGYHYGVVNQEAGSTVTVKNLDCSYNGFKTIYNMNGGTLNITGTLKMRAQCGWAMTGYIGDIYYQGPGDSGQVTHVNADGDYPWVDGEATFNLNGGVVNANALSFYNIQETNLQQMFTTKLNVAGGTLYLPGNQRALIAANIAKGYIVAYDGTETVNYSYFSDINKTVVTPEPMTLLMLGLGSVMAIRRRK